MLITFDSSNALILFFGKDEVYQTLQIVYKLCGQKTNRLTVTDKPKMAFFVPVNVKPSISDCIDIIYSPCFPVPLFLSLPMFLSRCPIEYLSWCSHSRPLHDMFIQSPTPSFTLLAWLVCSPLVSLLLLLHDDLLSLLKLKCLSCTRPLRPPTTITEYSGSEGLLSWVPWWGCDQVG